MGKTVHLVIGARPNFMKIAPLYHALKARPWANPVLVHTGQHSGAMMSDAFLRDLRLPEPHHHLGARGAGHAQMTAAVMVAYEALLLEKTPDCVVVAGDVNSTLAACISAKKLNLPVVHLEAGLRSGDRTMPEEQNRLVVDALSDLLWTPTADADENLLREGVPASRIDRVGNIMIDAYEMQRGAIAAAQTPQKLGLTAKSYGVVTLHRPSNVDHPAALTKIAAALAKLSADLELIFPVHPRTARMLEELGLSLGPPVRLIDPLGYIDFMSLVEESALVLTDSGGLQEEAVYLGIPCLTLRDTTERPITLQHGNRLTDADKVLADAQDALAHPAPRKPIPLWDGKTAGRACDSLERMLTP